MTRATTAIAIVVLGLIGLAGPAAFVSSALGQQQQQPAVSPAPHKPAPAPAPAEVVEQAPFRRSGSQATSSPTSQPAGAARAGGAAPQVGLARVFAALAVVIALIFLLRWVFRRLSAGIGGHRPSQAIRVLARNVIAPRQQLLVLQVGRRVVVVGDSGQQMSPLCEITDADEVAELVAQFRAERAEPLAKTFSTLFGRADAKYEAPPPSLPPATTARGGARNDADEDEYPRALPPGSGEDANVVAATREEIDGLMSRVRGLSQQFRRS